MAFNLNNPLSLLNNGFRTTNPTGFNNINPPGVFTSKSSFSSETQFTTKYNELQHKVEMYLDNSGNFNGQAENRYFINPAAVMNLQISESVNDWVTEGTMILMYLPEDADSDNDRNLGQSSATITGARQNAESLKSYQFRGDGYDILRIMVVPQTTDEGVDSIKIDESDFKWYLSYLFSVYDFEDVTDVPGIEKMPYMKCLKLYFRDARYQVLKAANIEYSTANSPYATYEPSYASVDPNRGTGGVTNTGIAILEVLNQALANPETGGSLEFGQLTGPDWDQGASKIFYTSPTESTALEDVDYLYAHHVSSTQLEGDIYDLALMHTKRSQTPTMLEQIALTPLSRFFEQAGSSSDSPGELQQEHFFITSLTDAQSPLRDMKAPIGGNNKDIDLKTSKYGQILSYSLVDMSAEANTSLFCTKPVYSVDIANRIFNVDFKNNNVLEARKLIADNYISKLYKGSSNSEELFLPVLHKTKETTNIVPTFSLNGDNPIVRQRKGILDLIYTGLFQNTCICFKTLGLTLRKSGTFIGIDKTAGSPDDDFYNKLCGQWFVVKVDHVFEAGAYVNNIFAIKIHRHKQRKVSYNDTI